VKRPSGEESGKLKVDLVREEHHGEAAREYYKLSTAVGCASCQHWKISSNGNYIAGKACGRSKELERLLHPMIQTTTGSNGGCNPQIIEFRTAPTFVCPMYESRD
jgi:hypothetical protein